MFWTSNEPSAPDATSSRRFPAIITACIGLIVLGTIPVAFSWPVAPTWSVFSQTVATRLAGRVLLTIIIAAAMSIVVWLDREKGPAKILRCCGCALLAALLTDLHFHTVDTPNLKWQMEQYLGIFSHHYPAPDQYRFLPQGTLWWMVLCSGDFTFSYVAYRFFFTFLLCQAIYTFARLYLSPRESVIVVLAYAVFYPLTIRYYYGNLLDPMCHAVMLAAVTCCQRRQFWSVFWLFALGVFTKETMLLFAPCYYLMNPQTFRFPDYQELRRMVLLGASGCVIFFACRIPFHFNYDFRTLNRTNELMIYSNLGFPSGDAWSVATVFERYLHPTLFIFMWLPFIIWRRKSLPYGLVWTALYLAAVIYLVNLFFSWNHESRNFVPVLVMLVVCTMVGINGLLRTEQPEIEVPTEGKTVAG